MGGEAPTLLAICHLIATTGWTDEYVDEMPYDRMAFWCGEFISYHNHIHRVPA